MSGPTLALAPSGSGREADAAAAKMTPALLDLVRPCGVVGPFLVQSDLGWGGVWSPHGWNDFGIIRFRIEENHPQQGQAIFGPVAWSQPGLADFVSVRFNNSIA